MIIETLRYAAIFCCGLIIGNGLPFYISGPLSFVVGLLTAVWSDGGPDHV